MCGVVGYAGSRHTVATLIDGLRRLEYRGYDSAGLAVIADNRMHSLKSAGKVGDLQQKVSEQWPNYRESCGGVGIAHTRWATHGPPTESNAHPHFDCSGRIAVVHNGIIDNHATLKARLSQRGCTFRSETDTEVLAHLISSCFEGDFVQAVATALKQVKGTFGIAVLLLDCPNSLVVARRGSPIAIGVGETETIVASDVSAIVSHTKQVIYLCDDDIAVLTPGGIDIRSLDNVPVSREAGKIDWDAEAAEKGGYEHFMLKEILEQPEAIENTIRGRLDDKLGTGILSGLNFTPREMAQIDRIVVAACGTSRHAGMVAEYFFEDLAGIPVEIEQAAELRYRNPIINPHNLVLALSQSGETADTLAAVREAKHKGGIVAGVCNVVGSTIARETGRGVYLHAGPEIGVASTKAFTCQVVVLLMMALKFGRTRRLSGQEGLELVCDIRRIPELLRDVLERRGHIEETARKYSSVEDMFFIGRGALYPVALEGALKLKEISYIHAEGYHAAELKHGPIALLEEKLPVVALANDVAGKEKMLANIQECRARGAPVIAVGTDGDVQVREQASEILWIPRASRLISPVLTAVVLQLFAYFFAKERGCEIDQPRNLAKSVTVE